MTNPHFELLQKAHLLLQPLSQKVVFLGGASVSLHLDDPAVVVRTTKDVDFVVEATSYAETAQVEAELRKLGFCQSLIEDGPMCRWEKDGLTLDMMPVDPTALGFGASMWFQEGFDQAERFLLPNQAQIYAFSVLHLIAVKIEAYQDRGDGDFLLSRDVEDIVTLVNGHCAIFTKLGLQSDLSRFILDWFHDLHQQNDLLEILSAHVMDDLRGDYLFQCLAPLLPNS